MTIKIDSKGFLIADGPVDNALMARGIDAVHSDTSAILALLRNGPRSASVMKSQRVSSQPKSATAAPPDVPGAISMVRSALAQTRARDERGRFSPNALGTLTGKQDSRKIQLTREEAAAMAPRVKVAEQVRDTKGRFVGRGGSRGRHGNGDGSDGEDSGDSLFRKLFSRVKDLSLPHVSGPDLSDYEKIDPTVEAMKEVSKIVGGPLASVGSLTKSGASRVFGMGKKKDESPSWLRKIFNVLKATHEDQSEFDLAEERTLKDLDHKGDHAHAEASGGLLGALGSGLSSLFGGRIGKLLGKGGGLLGSLFGGAMKFGKFRLKRLPLLGALFAGGSALASMFGGDDPNKTAEQNHQDRFTGAGSGIGALIGGGIGTLLGPIGTVVGGMIGDKVGGMVGGWLATVDWSKVGAQISGTWDSAVGTLTDAWKAVTDKLASISKTIGDAWDSILNGAKAFLKDKFGIDVDALIGRAKASVAPVVDAAKQVAAPVVDVAKKGVDLAKDAGKAAVDYGTERVEKMAAPIQTAASNTLDWGKGLIGKGSKGNKLTLMQGADQAGITDPNERAMFMAQMDHESGGFRSLEESAKYKPKQFLKLFGKRAGITTEDQAQAILDKGPSATFDAMYGGDWGAKKLGNTEAGDAERFKGRGFTQLTGRSNYAAAAQGTGLDLLNHPELAADPANAAKIATWYWQSKKGLSDAGKAGDVVEARKALNGGTIGLADVDKKYKAYLAAGAAMSTIDSASVVPPVATVASVSDTNAPGAVTVPAMPSPAAPPPAQMAAIPIPMNSSQPLEVRLADDRAVGQDLRNRRLAQIATGGVSG